MVYLIGVGFVMKPGSGVKVMSPLPGSTLQVPWPGTTSGSPGFAVPSILIVLGTSLESMSVSLAITRMVPLWPEVNRPR